jgi:hypothetical protein
MYQPALQSTSRTNRQISSLPRTRPACSVSTPPSFPGNGSGGDLLNENKPPARGHRSHRRLVRRGEHLKPDWQYLELTLFFCLQESTTLSPTSRSSTSPWPSSCTAQQSTSSVSPQREAGLCLPALPSAACPADRPSTLSPTQPGSITQSTRPIQPTAPDTSPQQKKPSPFKNRPPWAPGAIKNDEVHGATLSISVRSGERKCSDHDDSSDDSSDDELPSLSKIFGARPPQVTGPTGDSSDEVYNLPWPDRHWLHWLTLTRLWLAGIVPTQCCVSQRRQDP